MSLPYHKLPSFRNLTKEVVDKYQEELNYEGMKGKE